MLSLRSRHALWAVVAVVLLGAGCSSQTAGHPEFAGSLRTPTDLPTGGGIDGPTDSPSDSPSPSESSTASASASGSPPASGSPSASGSSGGLSPQEVADKICSSVSSDELRQIFDGPAEANPGLVSQCTFTAESASVLVYEFSSTSLSDVIGEAAHFTRLTVSGHPAIMDKADATVSVAETDSEDGPGIMRGVTLFGKPATTIALMEKAIKAFEH